MSRPTLRIGIIGHGFMGKMQAHCYRSLPFYYGEAPAQCILAGVATSRPETAEAARATWGYEFAETDYRALCARDDIDVIHCCTPNSLHREVLAAALEGGKHVYMDKPLTTSIADARAMVAIGQAHPDQVVQMCFNYRFVPALLRAKELADGGALGQLYHVRAAYLHAGYVDPARPFSWRLDPKLSGPSGALFDLGSHVIDLVRYLAGEVAEVHHLAKTFVPERPLKGQPGETRRVEVDDASILTVRMANGAIGTIESSRVATGVQDDLRLELHGSRGALRFNLMQPNYLEFYDNTQPEAPLGGSRGFTAIESVGRYPKPATLPGPKQTIGWERFHMACLYHFIACIAGGKPGNPGLVDGAKTQAIMHAALESSRSGAWSEVPAV